MPKPKKHNFDLREARKLLNKPYMLSQREAAEFQGQKLGIKIKNRWGIWKQWINTQIKKGVIKQEKQPDVWTIDDKKLIAEELERHLRENKRKYESVRGVV